MRKILSTLGEKAVLYYKPHPNDSKEKLNYYKKNFKQLKIYKEIEPAELLFYANTKLKAVISYQSSALLNVEKFSTNKVKVISLSKVFFKKVNIPYKLLFIKSKVIFLENVQDINSIIK